MKIEKLNEIQFHLIDDNGTVKFYELPYLGCNDFNSLCTLLNIKIEDNSRKTESLKYEQRQKDGLVAINNLMSELRLNSIQHNYPREVNKSIEIAFESVTKNILLGWWISAKEECELVQVQGYVTQGLKDRIYNTITTYISNNY